MCYPLVVVLLIPGYDSFACFDFIYFYPATIAKQPVASKGASLLLESSQCRDSRAASLFKLSTFCEIVRDQCGQIELIVFGWIIEF